MSVARAIVRGLGLAVPGADGPRWLVRGLDLDLTRGSWLAVIGPNGAGKTTLLRTIAGLRTPDEGTVELEGTALASWPVRQRARRIAWLPQHHPPWTDPTAFELVLLGRTPHLGALGAPRPEDRERAHEALARVDASALAQRRIASLSGGERQRVMLARMLASDAELLVLDEPTASLDVGHALRLLATCERLVADGVTLVTALHDLELARRRTSTVACLTGRDAAVVVGPPDEVLVPSVIGPAFGVRVSERVQLAFDRPDS
jgi:iron complex transport system ATP-binding protein